MDSIAVYTNGRDNFAVFYVFDKPYGFYQLSDIKPDEKEFSGFTICFSDPKFKSNKYLYEDADQLNCTSLNIALCEKLPISEEEENNLRAFFVKVSGIM